MGVQRVKQNNNNIYEGEATRLAELALIFIPTVFIALSAKYRSQLHYK